MKRILLNLMIAGLVTATSAVNAATFTAVQSGDWSLASTWGGTAPAFNIFADDINIPAGITVNLDDDLMVDGLLAELNVTGALQSSLNSSIMIEQGLLTGTGSMNVHRIEFGSTANSTFTGSLNADVLATNSYNLLINGTTEVMDSIMMMGGDIQVMASQTLTVGANSVIWAEGGSISGAGTFAASGSYDIYYMGSSSFNSGMEMTTNFVNDVVVELDNSSSTLELDGDATINGTLDLNVGRYDMSGSSLTLMGDFEQSANALIQSNDQSELWIMSATSLTSSLVFDGSNNEMDRIVIDIHDGGQASFDSDIQVVSEIRLAHGDMAIESGNAATLAANGMIWINDGEFVTNGSATFENQGMVNIIYTGSNKNSGVELMSGTVANLTVDLNDNTQWLMLTSDVMIIDTADFSEGWVVLNSNDLMLTGYTWGDGNIMIDGDGDAMVWLEGEIASATTFEFEEGDSLSSFVLDIQSQSEVWVQGSLNVMDSLTMNSGTMVVSNSNLWVRDGAVLNGGSEDSYIITDGYAKLSMMVQGNNQGMIQFPVGDDDGYSPIRIMNSASNNAEFAVNLSSTVLAQGTTGYDHALSDPVVNKTWDIEAASGTEVDLMLEAEWTSAMEVNGFNRSSAYISHYVDGAWDTHTTTAAQTTTSGSYMLTRDGITSLSPFAVANEGSLTAVADFASSPLEIYPNPAVNEVFINLNDTKVDYIRVYDLNGKKITEFNTANNNGIFSVDLNDYDSGVYFMEVLTDGENIATERIVKL